jgi:hypothetical protein
MKRIISLCILVINLQTSAATTGLITQTGVFDAANTYRTAKYYVDSAVYVNSGAGGLTFGYPTDYWITPGDIAIPRVTVSVLLNNPPLATETYVVVVTANSNISTTVMVYRVIDGGSVIEASTGEVTVVLFAI